MVVKFFLVLMMIGGEVAPAFVGKYGSFSSCTEVADKLNKSPQMNTEEALERRFEYVCLQRVDNTY